MHREENQEDEELAVRNAEIEYTGKKKKRHTRLKT
jgi:hypothetical protein